MSIWDFEGCPGCPLQFVERLFLLCPLIRGSFIGVFLCTCIPFDVGTL